MTNKIFALFALSVFVFAFLIAGVSAATLVTWDFSATSTTAAATSSNANLVASAITTGAGIPDTFTFSANGITADQATGTDWDGADVDVAITDGDFYEITL